MKCFLVFLLLVITDQNLVAQSTGVTFLARQRILHGTLVRSDSFTLESKIAKYDFGLEGKGPIYREPTEKGYHIHSATIENKSDRQYSEQWEWWFKCDIDTAKLLIKNFSLSYIDDYHYYATGNIHYKWIKVKSIPYTIVNGRIHASDSTFSEDILQDVEDSVYDFFSGRLTITNIDSIFRDSLPTVLTIDLPITRNPLGVTSESDLTFNAFVYPNPSNRGTQFFSYELSEAEIAQIDLFTSTGERITTLTASYHDKGKHKVALPKLNAGSYFVQVRSKGKTVIVPFIIIE